ncbi:MAG: RusA family crossover junction endodeoxyribonuclease [Nitrospirae bacterium]|nr:RusA family crossover junction endodeoxyribonuclease [Nitrospirota bacterium]
MYYFIIVDKTPKSLNSPFKTPEAGNRYKEYFRKSLIEYNPNYEMYETDDIYGIIYYFYREHTAAAKRPPDVDNIAKLIWDSLTKHLYNSDAQLKYTINGIFNVPNDYDFRDDDNNLDLNVDLIGALISHDEVIYIECGKMDNSFYKINIEKQNEN